MTQEKNRKNHADLKSDNLRHRHEQEYVGLALAPAQRHDLRFGDAPDLVVVRLEPVGVATNKRHRVGVVGLVLLHCHARRRAAFQACNSHQQLVVRADADGLARGPVVQARRLNRRPQLVGAKWLHVQKLAHLHLWNDNYFHGQTRVSTKNETDFKLKCLKKYVSAEYYWKKQWKLALNVSKYYD